MKLSELRKDPAEGPVVVVASEVEGDEQSPSADSPTGVVQSTTPSGIGIYYQEGPVRLYRICDQLDPTGQTVEEWRQVPSVSTPLEVLEKGGLSWWGMKVGIAGALKVAVPNDLDRVTPELHHDGPEVQAIVDRLTPAKLTVNHIRDHAATRGTNVHTGLELYAECGVIPAPELYPEHERGYVAGVRQFLIDAKPVVEHSELMVASAEHGFAGRFDLVAQIDEGRPVATKCYPKRASVIDPFPGGRVLIDLKTSKGVYASYHIQLAGYRAGLVECGYGDVDIAGVVRVTPEGKYEFVPGRAVLEDYLAVLDTWNRVRRIEGKA